MRELQGHGQTHGNRTQSPASKTDMSQRLWPALRHRWQLQGQPLSDQFRRTGEFPSHVDYLDVEEDGEKRDRNCQAPSLAPRVGDPKEAFKHVQWVLSHSVTRNSAYQIRELERLKAMVIFLWHLPNTAMLHRSGQDHRNVVRKSKREGGISALFHSLQQTTLVAEWRASQCQQ